MLGMSRYGKCYAREHARLLYSVGWIAGMMIAQCDNLRHEVTGMGWNAMSMPGRMGECGSGNVEENQRVRNYPTVECDSGTGHAHTKSWQRRHMTE